MKKNFSFLVMTLCILFLCSLVAPSFIDIRDSTFEFAAKGEQSAELTEEDWREISAYSVKISLDKRGGEDGQDEILATNDEELQVFVPKKSGYDFYGYFTESDGEGVRYFDQTGKKCKGIIFNSTSPKTLFASWIKLSSGKIEAHNGVPIAVVNKVEYTSGKNVGLSIEKLKEIGYKKIEVNFTLELESVFKNEILGDVFLEVDGKTSLKASVGVTNDIQNKYYTAILNIETFNDNSQFRIGLDFPICKLIKAHIYFTAIDKVTKISKDSEKLLNTKSYGIPDNIGYDVSKATSSTNPIGSNFADISLRLNGGELIESNKKENGIDMFGYFMDDENGDKLGLELLLKYNFTSKENINDSKWTLSNDGWKGSVNGINGAGVVNSGALLVSKSNDGKNWIWENPYSNTTTQSYHSVDFINNNLLNEYNGKINNVKRLSPVYAKDYNGDIILDVNGNPTYVHDSDYKIVYQEVYSDIDGYLPIYRPSGQDLASGIFIKVTFAYELCFYTYSNGFAEFFDGWFNETKTWEFINVVEETVFYIANGSGKVLFQNMNFTTAGDTAVGEKDGGYSKLVRQFGYIKDGHAANDAFKLNLNGNTSYEVHYSKNGSNNLSGTKAYDGQIFTEPGKYEFYVVTKFDDITEKLKSDSKPDYTIYINDRGIGQNLSYYFTGGNLITNDSERIFSLLDEVPVYKAGKTYWSTKTIDANHMPLVGRIGYFIETLSVREYRQKYYIEGEDSDTTIFKIDTKVQVNGDYVQMDGDGYAEITKKDNNGNDITVRTISGYNIYKKVAEKVDDNRESVGNIILTEVGQYVAQFANNLEYFNDTASGDVYTFNFRFRITNEEVKPSINQHLLETNIGFADYASAYYGITFQSAGNGKITFAYANYAEAYNCAYEYYRSLVTKTAEGYLLGENKCNSQFEVLSKVDEFAKNLVKREYFDATDSRTYLTAKISVKNAIKADLAQNIVVFDGSTSAITTATKLPYLNDRKYSYLDENNEVHSGVNSIRFTQVADYESSEVRLIYMGSEGEIDFKVIPYGVSAQSFLEGKGAPTGTYKIVETNVYGDKNEYFAIYIKPGDNRISLEVTRIDGVNQQDETIGQKNAEKRFIANGFVLKSAINQIDINGPVDFYGLVKIKNLATHEVEIFALDELDNYIIDKQGNYEIHLVDRLGNTIRFYVDIYTPSKFSELTLKDGNNIIETRLVGGGTRVHLKDLPSSDNNIEFIGWQDGQGKILNGEFLYGYDCDTTLSAVWRFKNTTITIYDGLQIGESLSKKPDDTVILPMPTKIDYEFFGFAYTQLNGTIKFYYGQITSVPNVQGMRLDAVWIDRNVKVTANYGDSLTPPQTEAGLIFYGWSTGGLTGRIFYDSVDFDMGGEVTLYALYKSDPNSASQVPQGIAAGIFENISGTLSTLAGFISQTGPIASLALSVLYILAMFAVLINKKKQQINGGVTAIKTGVDQINTLRQSEVQETIKLPFAYKKLKKLKRVDKKQISGSKFSWNKLVMPAVCMLLVLVMGAVFNQRLLLAARESYDAHAYEAEITRKLEEYKELVYERQEEREEEERKREEYIERATEAFNKEKSNTTAEYISFNNKENDIQNSTSENSLFKRAVNTLENSNLVGSTNSNSESKNDNEETNNTTINTSLNTTSSNEEITPQALSETSDGETPTEEISDSEAFLYSLIFLDLISFGYDVFPANAIIGDGVKIKGFGYTDYEESYTKESNEKIYIGVGFVPLLNETQITEEDCNAGVEIELILTEEEVKENPELTEYGLLLTFEEEWGLVHYIAYERYVTYEVKDFRINTNLNENIKDNIANYDTWGESLGYLYNYDLGRTVYDPDLGKEFEKSGYSIINWPDIGLNDKCQTIITYQNANAISVEAVNIISISYESIYEYLLHDQEESYLGISTEYIQYLESQIDSSVYYYVDGETGEMKLLPFHIEKPDNSGFWWWLAGAMIVVGALTVVICTAGTATPLVIPAVVTGVYLPMTAVTAIAAGIAFFGGAALAGISLLAAGKSARVLIETGSWDYAVDTFNNYGQMAFWATVITGALGALQGYLVYQANKAFEKAMDSRSAEIVRPKQNHHFVSNKNKYWTPKFEEITKKYNLDLNKDWNVQTMQHLGRHTNAYHSYIMGELVRIDSIAQGNKAVFAKLMEDVVKYIIENPNILYK